MIAGNEPADGMLRFIFFHGEEASAGWLRAPPAGSDFPDGARKKRGSSTRLRKPEESFFVVQEGMPIGILPQFHLLRRKEQRREVGRFFGVERKAWKEE